MENCMPVCLSSSPPFLNLFSTYSVYFLIIWQDCFGTLLVISFFIVFLYGGRCCFVLGHVDDRLCGWAVERKSLASAWHTHTHIQTHMIKTACWSNKELITLCRSHEPSSFPEWKRETRNRPAQSGFYLLRMAVNYDLHGLNGS